MKLLYWEFNSIIIRYKLHPNLKFVENVALIRQ